MRWAICRWRLGKTFDQSLRPPARGMIDAEDDDLAAYNSIGG